MSYDKQIEQVCPHQVVEEALFLSRNRQSVRPLRPISSALSVKVRVNALAEVPFGGKHIPAVAKCGIIGPYTVKEANNTLIIDINSNINTIVCPPGKDITMQVMAGQLSALLAPMGLAAVAGKGLQIRTFSEGINTNFRILPGSTLAPTLGLVQNKVYRGQEIYPSWSLIKDPNTLDDRPTRLIVFDTPIDGTNDFVEISYNTVQQECRRCGGAGVENDWRYDATGEVVKVQGSNLLRQEVLKIIYTKKRSNPFQLWYGTDLVESIGKKITDKGLVQSLILSDLQAAFKNWQKIKAAQESIGQQFVSDEEYPFRLSAVKVLPTSDPTVILVEAFAQSRSSANIQLTRGLKLPFAFT